MSNVVLGLDLDGVLYDWHDAVFTYFQYEMGYSEDYLSFWTKYIPSLSKEKQDYIVSIPILYETKIPSSSIMEFLKFASENAGSIYYITSRALELDRITRRYIRKYDFPFQDNLIFTNDKATACRLYGVTHFLDDFVIHVKSTSKVAESYLMAKPWNKEYQEELPTVFSLKEFKERIF